MLSHTKSYERMEQAEMSQYQHPIPALSAVPPKPVEPMSIQTLEPVPPSVGPGIDHGSLKLQATALHHGCASDDDDVQFVVSVPRRRKKKRRR